MQPANDFLICIEFGKTEKEHSHQEIELVYVLDGTIELILADEKYLLEKESILLINSGKAHAWKEKGECLLSRIYMDYGLVADMQDFHFINFWCNSLLNQDRDYSRMRSILHSLIKEYSAGGGKDSFLLQSMKYQVLDCLIKNFIFQGEYQSTGMKDERIEQAVVYINQNYSRQISLGEAASFVYLSESSFSRLFKKVTGTNFVEYVNSVRLHYAVHMLLYSNKSVIDIAVACGFSGPSVFNKLFKKTYQCSPTQYREEKKASMTLNSQESSAKAQEKLKEFLAEKKTVSTGRKDEAFTVSVPHVPAMDYAYEGNQGINMGIGADLLQARLREHLEKQKRELGFRYVRISALFYKTMYVYTKSRKKFNFAHIDNVLDYITELGMYPMIDLSFQAKRAYLSLEKNMFEEDELDMEPLKLTEWQSLLREFISHVTFRYGEICVREWIFEYNCHEYPSTQNYEEFWEVTYHALKDGHPEYQLGGDGFRLDSDYEKFYRHCEYWISRQCVPDFLTVYGYPYRGFCEDSDVYQQRETDFDFIKNGLERYKRNLAQFFAYKKIILSEWNTSISERNYYNDSCAKAAHIVRQMILLAGSGCIACYNHGSDFLSQYYDSVAPIVGAIGLMTKDGIPKPSYYAFAFLNKLHQKILCKGKDYIVTSNDRGNYYILACNPKNFNHIYFMKKEHEIKIADMAEIFEDDCDQKIKFCLPAEDGKMYRIKKHLLSEQNGGILYEWQNMDYLDEFGQSDVEYLKNICRPHMYCENRRAMDGMLEAEITLHKHDVLLMHVYQTG